MNVILAVMGTMRELGLLDTLMLCRDLGHEWVNVGILVCRHCGCPR